MQNNCTKNAEDFEERDEEEITNRVEQAMNIQDSDSPVVFSEFHGKIQQALGGLAFVFCILNVDENANEFRTALAIACSQIEWSTIFESFSWSADGKSRKTIKIGGKAKDKSKGTSRKVEKIRVASTVIPVTPIIIPVASLPGPARY